MSNNFYFIRHGQTQLNYTCDIYNESDVDLNETGRGQAENVRALIEKLPLATVCISPLKRAIETAAIITMNLNLPHVIVGNLAECTGEEWVNLIEWERGSYTIPLKENTKSFMWRAMRGVNEALEQQGPVLVVAHGGIYWSLCHILNIKNHDRIIDNCAPVHVKKVNGEWVAERLI